MSPEAPPLGVYVHWPYCARVCPYCDFNVVRDRGRKAEQAALVEAIAADLTAHAALTGPRTLVSVFLGGGTPSLMDPGDAGRLVALAKSLWSPAAGGEVEVTLEANPTDAEAGRFGGFADAGVNRLSLGVQALDDASLAFLGRNHDAATARAAVSAGARAFPRLSLDLIYALPGQDEAAWAEALARAVDLGAEHLSPYQLSIEAGTAFDRAVRRGRFEALDPEMGARLFELTQARLEGFGFEAYEVSNHARGPAARSRHNLIYWRGQDYVGVGPGAHGRLTLGSAQRLATEGEKAVGDYVGRVRSEGLGWAVREPLGPVAIAEERLLNGLRTLEGVAWTDLSALGLAPSDPRVEGLQDLGLIRRDTNNLRTTAEGRLLLDRLMIELVS